ncbi:hypothetical protein M758_8G026600 [Ceratodon purpureus]|nr:hypothetical protein M758_8G026600 [Ceratodon purpureus]
MLLVPMSRCLMPLRCAPKCSSTLQSSSSPGTLPFWSSADAIHSLGELSLFFVVNVSEGTAVDHLQVDLRKWELVGGNEVVALVLRRRLIVEPRLASLEVECSVSHYLLGAAPALVANRRVSIFW